MKLKSSSDAINAKICRCLFAIPVIVCLLNGCATESVAPQRMEKVAVITSGSSNIVLATNFMPTVSVVEVDGKAVSKPYGPIEIEPGLHTVKMKCADSTNTRTIEAAAGDVYEFAMIAAPGESGCQGSLNRTRAPRK